MTPNATDVQSEVDEDRLYASDWSLASVLRDWRWWIGPAALSLVLALIFLDPFAGDWDAIDYTVLAIKGQPSSMALGRSLFIFLNAGLWRSAHLLFHISPEKAYLIFKYAVVVETPVAICACWNLARCVGSEKKEATLAVILIALSPAFVVYSGQAMTEIPALLLLAVALAVHIKGLASKNLATIALGAALLGAGVNIREPVGFFAPWLVFAPFAFGWKFDRRTINVIAISTVAFCVFAFGIFAIWFLADIGQYRAAWNGWRLSMAEESARHPLSLRNVVPFVGLFVASSPLVTLSLPFAFIRKRVAPTSPMLLLAAVGLFATLLLIGNYSSTVNWRYFLTALPVFAPLVARFWIGRTNGKPTRVSFRFAVIAVLAFSGIAGGVLRPVFKRQVERRALTPEYLDTLKQIPEGSVLIAGAQSVAVNYFVGIGAGQWEAIGTGSGWPGEKIIPLITEDLNSGKRVFLDTDPRVWPLCGWQRDEIPTLVGLGTAFKFKQTTATVFELRPRTDSSATASVDLGALMPERRPAELGRCVGGR